MSAIEFTQELHRLEKVLNGFAYNLTKNVENSKDLFQETAYRALANRDKFRPGTNLKAWLFTIMKNIFINDYRKKSKANTIIDTTDNLYYINSSRQAIDNGGDSNIMMKELTAMVDGLDNSIRVPFLLHYQGYKYKEIAIELDLPLGTVKSRIFFARRELMKQINGKYGSLK
ncbi:MAG: RNA polymerase sigma factor [Bacteroidia bacterium]|nr:RNA polymerase sigma factor [Bacteroidia bacterium]